MPINPADVIWNDEIDPNDVIWDDEETDQINPDNVVWDDAPPVEAPQPEPESLAPNMDILSPEPEPSLTQTEIPQQQPQAQVGTFEADQSYFEDQEDDPDADFEAVNREIDELEVSVEIGNRKAQLQKIFGGMAQAPIPDTSKLKGKDIAIGGSREMWGDFWAGKASEGLGAVQTVLDKILDSDVYDFLSKIPMSAEQEKRLRAEHPTGMALRYAALSSLPMLIGVFPGIAEKIASPMEMEEFIRLPPEKQRDEILGIAGEYAAAGLIGKGVSALTKMFPRLKKPLFKGKEVPPKETKLLEEPRKEIADAEKPTQKIKTKADEKGKEVIPEEKVGGVLSPEIEKKPLTSKERIMEGVKKPSSKEVVVLDEGDAGPGEAFTKKMPEKTIYINRTLTSQEPEVRDVLIKAAKEMDLHVIPVADTARDIVRQLQAAKGVEGARNYLLDRGITHMVDRPTVSPDRMAALEAMGGDELDAAAAAVDAGTRSGDIRTGTMKRQEGGGGDPLAKAKAALYGKASPETRERLMNAQDLLAGELTQKQRIISQLKKPKVEASPEVITRETPPVPSEIKFKPIPPGAKRQVILKEVQNRLNLPIKVGKVRLRKAAGTYNPHSKVVRLKYANDFPVAIHEVGHHVQDLIGLGGRMPKEIMAMAYKGAKNKSREGFAEFVRHYVTDPDFAKKGAPEFYKTFEKALAPQIDMQEIFLKARQAWKVWEAAPSVQKVESVIVQGGTIKKRRTTLNEIYTELKDAKHPIRVATNAARALGGKFDSTNDPYIAARLLPGWPRMVENYLKHSTYQRVGDEIVLTGPPLNKILAPVEAAGERPLLDTYLVAKRAVNDPRIVKGFRGQLTLQDFKQTVKDLEPKYKDVAEALYKYNNELLQYLVDAGHTSKELAKRIRAKNLFYAPLYRLMDTSTPSETLGRKTGTVSSPIKKLRGSSRDILSPTENIMKNTYAIINAAERTRVGQAILGLADVPGMGRWIEKVPFPMKATKMETKEALEQVSRQLGQAGDMETQIALDQIIGQLEGEPGLVSDVLTTFRADKTRVGKNEVQFRVDGEPVLVELDPWLHKAVVGLESGEINLLIKVLSYPAKWLRAGATTFSPEFPLRNPFKDQWTALIQSENNYIPVLDLIRGILQITGEKKAWIEFNASGGPLSHIVSMDQKHIHKDLKAIMKGSSMVGLVKNPLSFVQKFSELGEEGTRMGEFLRARGKGKGLKESGFAAKEVSLDFSRIGGSGARAANLIAAFWNASLEGFDKLGRTFGKRPMKTTILGFLGVTLPTLLLWYEQKDDPIYQELSAVRRTMAWNYIQRDADGNFIRVWSLYRPFTYGLLFGAVPEMVMNWWYKQDKAGLEEAFVQILKTLNFIPIPTGAIPFIETWGNRSLFYDRPIVPRDKEGLEPHLQFGRYTSETTKLVGRLIKDIPMLKEMGSPAKIENFIRGYLAGFGRMALEGTDWLLKQMGAIETPPDVSMTLNDIPGIRAFTARFPGANAASIERFYKEYNNKRRFLESRKQEMGIRGKGLKGAGFGAQFPKLEETAKALSLHRKIVDSVYNDRQMSPDHKKQLLDLTYYQMINAARIYYGKEPFIMAPPDEVVLRRYFQELGLTK